MILVFGHRIDLILVLAVVLVALSVLYGMFILVLSRFEPQRSQHRRVKIATVPGHHKVVFLIPCLNEERVLRPSLERLAGLDHPDVQIMVIDDGSDDGTAEIVRSFPDPRVHLFQRTLPRAREGKGEALNAAIQYLRTSDLIAGTPHSDVVVCVMDADGRLDPHALDDVMPLFKDNSLGAVQIGVRINNRQQNLLARVQDLEFVLYTHVFQRGRRHLGSVGLGGNGQFVRLSALDGLGVSPWSRSLTEDLDLGVRLLMDGWQTEFVSTASVHQQGLVDVKRWVKQRTRWFQGHLQSWNLVPWVLRDLTGSRRADLLYHLTSPFLLLLTSFLSLAFAFWVLDLAVGIVTGHAVVSGWWLSSYLIAFGPALLYGLVYWSQERHSGLNPVKAVGLVHLYVLYAVLWYVAGWKAAWRAVRGHNGWAKTERVVENQEQVDSSARELTVEAHA
ncbi:glycosyltransferase family 2 protein [Kocuria sp. CPCC 204721]|uniref:glycosyltransferase family 2 protein n=1 Tax=Kocuria sp. CPCC 204721 TaxID=3073548 RepID=UPI0034D552AF